MAKIKKGDRLECVPCGREVAVSLAGVSETTLWCCGRPMEKKGKVKSGKRSSQKKKSAKK